MRFLGRFILLSLALLGLVTMAAVGGGIWFVASHAAPKPLPQRVVLTVDLDRGVSEAAPTGPLAALRLRGAYPLRDIADALEKGANDPRVAALVVRVNDPDMRMARAQEIRGAVEGFRKAGKRAVLFSESVGGTGNGTVAYYLATAFDEIWLQPSGDLALTGFSVESPFLRDALDELAIKAEFGARHEYKSAIEVFTEKGYSEPNRSSLKALLTAWNEQVVAAVAQARRLPVEQIRAAMDKAPLLAEEARTAGLVDRLGYWDQVENAMTAGGAELLDVRSYVGRVGRPHASGAKVAVIYGLGAIHTEEDDVGPLGGDRVLASETVAKALREAAEDKEVKAVLLRLDSPGGSYVASDTVWRAVHKVRETGKPVIASMGDMAASGGYFIAMAADRIVANPGSITGSIGVFAGKLVLRDFWQKVGVSWDQVQVGANAGMWSANQPFNEAGWNRLQTALDRIYDDFTGKLAQARKLDAAAVDGVARGRIWSGADAHRVGLVDELGGWSTALQTVRREIGLASDAPIALEQFPRPKGAFAEAMETLRTGRLPDVAALADAAAALVRLARLAAPLLHRLEAVAARSGELREPLGLPTSGK